MSRSSRSQPLGLAVLALLGEARRPACVREEPGVAATAATAAGREPGVAVVHEVRDDLAGLVVPDRRAFGDVDDEVLATRTVALVPGAVRAGLRLAVRVVPEREQRRDVAVGLQPDVAALAAVPTVGAALGHVRFAPHRDRARAAVAALDVELGLVDEPAVLPITHAATRLCIDSSPDSSNLSGERTAAKQRL